MSVYAKEKSEFLSEALDSIISQTVVPDEIVLVEDGPLPIGLTAVIEKYKEVANIISVKLQKNVGLGIALNKGLEACSYELVARMDSDDICHKNRFEKQLDFMHKKPDVDICSSWMEEFEYDISNIKALKKVPESHWQIANYIGSRNPMNHPAVMFKKSKVLNSGGYKHFPLFEDWFLWVRMFIKGAKFANIQESLLYFRTSSQLYKRRGGWSYALGSARFQWTLHKLGIISSISAITSSIIRVLVCLMPNKLREVMYNKFLRS